MQMTNSKNNVQRQSRWFNGAALGLCLGMGLAGTGVARAQTPPGGFQSDVTGAVPINFAVGPGGAALGGPNGLVAIGALPADVQTTLQAAGQTLTGAVAGLSTADFAAAEVCIGNRFPDSPAVREYRRAVAAINADIVRLNDSSKTIMPGDNNIHRRDVYTAAGAASSLRKNLMSLVRANKALARTATPNQMECVTQTYDAVEKAVAALEQIAPALTTITRITNTGH